MIDQQRTAAGSDEGIDLVAFCGLAWRNKSFIVSSTVVCGLIAAYFAFTAIPLFRAEVVVTEVHDRSTGGAASLVNQLGGLVNLGGVGLRSGDSASVEAQAVLQSRYLVETFITRQNLLPQIFPKDGKYATLWRAVRKFRSDVLNIRQDVRRGVTTIGIEWTDPATAARWANELIALANELIRTRALDDSSRNILYLKDQIGHTNVIELQRVLYNLIENETKTLMLANERTEYAFMIVDPAVAPEVHVSPKRTVITLFGIVIGLILGTSVIVVRDNLRRRRGVADRGR